jgi:hypothetical protein
LRAFGVLGDLIATKEEKEKTFFQHLITKRDNFRPSYHTFTPYKRDPFSILIAKPG